MQDRIFVHRRPSPVGPLLLVSDGTALIGLYTQHSRDVRELGPGFPGFIEEAAPFREVESELDRYFAGEVVTFRAPLRVRGTPFQQAVWSALTTIPHGTTISYAELAARIGNPRAVRAVGAANGKNPISIIVPCHRVIGADGDLVGYGGGLPCKQWLLHHEGVHPSPRSRKLRDYGSTAARATAAIR